MKNGSLTIYLFAKSTASSGYRLRLNEFGTRPRDAESRCAAPAKYCWPEAALIKKLVSGLERSTRSLGQVCP